MRLSKDKIWKFLSLKSCAGAESFNQVIGNKSANGLLNDKARSTMPRLFVNGGLEINISQFSENIRLIKLE